VISPRWYLFNGQNDSESKVLPITTTKGHKKKKEKDKTTQKEIKREGDLVGGKKGLFSKKGKTGGKI